MGDSIKMDRIPNNGGTNSESDTAFVIQMLMVKRIKNTVCLKCGFLFELHNAITESRNGHNNVTLYLKFVLSHNIKYISWPNFPTFVITHQATFNLKIAT